MNEWMITKWMITYLFEFEFPLGCKQTETSAAKFVTFIVKLSFQNADS